MLDKDDTKKYIFMFNNNSKKTEKKIVKEKDETFDNGIEKITKTIPNNIINETEKEEIELDFFQKIFKHLIPLICIYSIGLNNTSFIEMFNYITENKKLLKLLENQLSLWFEENNNILSIIMELHDKYIKENKEINSVIERIKELFLKHSNNPSKLSQLLDEYLIPQEMEKKKNAEVSTPYILRQEMLDKIPELFWKTPKKIFEPCVGKGGFLIDIVERFMKHLDIEDEEEKYRIIVEECLYFSDINDTNIFICNLLLDPNNKYKLNYNEGDTLKIDIKEKWGLDGFDAVIGNPPYQAPSNSTKNSKILWDLFVIESLNIWLLKNGYLLFVHPSLWRKPKHYLNELMFNKQILYLKIFNDVDGNKIFGASTRFDYYLIENKKKYTKTKIIFEDKTEINIMLDNIKFIPNFGWSIFEKIFKKLNNDNNIKTYSSSKLGTSNKNVNIKKDDIFKYELFNSSSKLNGITFRYSKIKHEIQDKKKVLFSNGRYIKPFYDNGKYGITQGGIYILVDNETEGLNVIKFLESKFIKYIIKATKWSNFETNKDIFWFIVMPNIEITDDNVIYKYFELTKNEIKIIEK